MHMGASGAVKHAAHKEFIVPEEAPADRADPGPVPIKTIDTAPDVHEPVLAGKRGKGHGFDQFALLKPGGTDRTGLGSTGNAFPPGASFPFVPFGVMGARTAGKAEEEGVAKPEQYRPYGDKGQSLNE
jgi:hypothetical protein